MPRVAPRLVTVLVGVLMVTGAPLVVAAPASAKIWKVPAPDLSLDPLVNLNEYENRIVRLINKRRKADDLKPVRYFESCLDKMSERWARRLAETGELKHRNQKKILRRCDLDWTGETLVRGTALAPAAAVKAWMKSPGHRAVIMKPRAKRAGMGAKLDDQGRIVGVLNFGDPA